ncbi:MAG TPA: hypothetical protein VKL40_01900 [Candidatus Angelobacter sp.]|nr:hypothetical protein [Candidatus Angelobacter sp.]
MARWNSLKDAVVLALKNWRLWLLQFVGNVAIFLAFVGWLQIKEAHWWQLVFSLLLAALLVSTPLVLHGGTLNYFESAHQDRSARLLPAFRSAVKHLAALVVWFLVVHFLWHVATHLEAYSTSFPGYLRSEFPAWLRRMISEPALDNTYSFLLWLLLFVVLPGLFLPFAMFAAGRGFRGLIALRDWRRTVANPVYWIALVVAAVIGVYCTPKIMDWKLDPKTATLSAEKTSLAFRLLFAYLLAIFSWLLACSALGRASLSSGQAGSQPT